LKTDATFSTCTLQELNPLFNPFLREVNYTNPRQKVATSADIDTEFENNDLCQ